MTLDELIEFFEEFIDIDKCYVEPDSILGEHIPIDSADMLRILSRLENRFQIHFKPNEMMLLETLDDLLGMVNQKTAPLQS